MEEFWIVSALQGMMEALVALARVVPAMLMLPTAFITVQGILTGAQGYDIGAQRAIEATLHGEHLDIPGLAWSIGIAVAMTAAGMIARAAQRRSRRRQPWPELPIHRE